MDRLLPLGLLFALALAWPMLGCVDTRDKKPPEATSRVNAVKAVKAKGPTPSEFCDKLVPAGENKFAFPALDGPAPKLSKTSWSWINVWATWCEPCIEEMPLIEGWQRALAKQGSGFDLHLVSADESQTAVDEFLAAHKEIRASHRLSDADRLGEWSIAVGLDAAAPLPIHVFVDREGNVRCLRAGGVSESELPAIRALLAM